MMKKLSLILVLCSAAFYAAATNGPYVEFNLGYSNTSSGNFSEQGTSFNTRDPQHFGWNGNVGVMLLNMGLELGYTHFGDSAYQGATNTATAGLSGTHLAAVLENSLGPIFINGALGVGQLQQTSFNIDNTNVPTRSVNSLFWSIGAGLKVLPTVAIQASYQQFQGTSSIPTANLTSLGVIYTFL